MAPPELTDYELNRLENIRRNNEMMAALKVQSKASELRAKVKRTVKPKLKTKTPVVTRSSLRTRGIPPDSNGLTRKSPNKFATLGPFSMKDAYKGIDDSDHSFIESLVGTSNKEFSEEDLNRTAKKKKIESSLDLESLSLYPKNIVRVGPGRTSRRITQVQFLPSNNVKMIVAGCQVGDIGIWNVGQSKVFLYRPHQTIISGISVHPNCLSKIYTSCNNGFVRMMDAQKEIFDIVYNSSDGRGIYALSQPKNDANCLYIAEGSGSLTVWDNRIGKCSSPPHFALHRRRINTIDFDPENPHIAVTSSTDGTACTWDFRCTGDKSNLTALKTFTYERALQSAYFSPSGCSIATTSLNNMIGIHKGVNFEDAAVVNLESIQKCFSTYRAIWGWDDSYLFTGSDTRGVSVVSTAQKATVMTLESPLITAYPQKLVAHPYEVGMLAGGTSGGKVYIWTSRQDF
ncbi:WD repeat-containing protein [Trifolium repens]|nr:WD repeat-containing protein [Trifolium repens]